MRIILMAILIYTSLNWALALKLPTCSTDTECGCAARCLD